LEPTIQELGTVVVTERQLSRRLQEFEQRRKAGFGQFFTRADIEKRQPLTVMDVMRGASSVRIMTNGRGGWNAVSTRDMNTCFMQVYLDAIPLAPARGEAFDLSALPSPDQIAAIEVYAGAATVPLWLAQGSGGRKGCGAILIWTADASGN
jgi:outer membrane cobalamin receptor